MILGNASGDLSPSMGQRRQRPLGRLQPNPKLPLREQVREVMRFFHYSQRTEETYWQWIVRYLRFHRGRGEGTGVPGVAGQAPGGGERSDGKGQRANGRGQRAEGKGQMAEGQGQVAEGKSKAAKGEGAGAMADGKLPTARSPKAGQETELRPVGTSGGGALGSPDISSLPDQGGCGRPAV
jgi:hypothetical protein